MINLSAYILIGISELHYEQDDILKENIKGESSFKGNVTNKNLDFGTGINGENKNLNLEIITKNIDANKSEKLLDSNTDLNNEESSDKSNTNFFNRVLVLILIHKVIESLGSMSIKYYPIFWKQNINLSPFWTQQVSFLGIIFGSFMTSYVSPKLCNSYGESSAVFIIEVVALTF